MLKEGQVLNDTYQIVRLIGEGGMGAVYEATHARLAGRYAVKVLLPDPSDLDSAHALARFEREAKTTSLLQHPNIVQIVDFNSAADGTRYLVMEYLQGQSLADRIFREGALPQGTVVGIVQQVAAALAVAHSRGVVHRDLKPDNVFLVPVEGRRDEQVKLLDFGISKVRDPSRGIDGPPSVWGPVSAMMGTPQYMAPEQCQGRTSEIDSATDQFALAVITYEMLTGRVPFEGDSVGAVLSGVLHCDPPPMSVAPGVAAVVRRGLAKKNRDRFASVTAFAEALRAAVTEQPNEEDLTVPMAAPLGEMPTSLTGPATVKEGLRRRVIATSGRRRKWALGFFTAAAIGVTAFLAVGNDPRLETLLRRAAVAIPFAQGAPSRDVPPSMPATSVVTQRATVTATAIAPRIAPAPTSAASTAGDDMRTAGPASSALTADGFEVVPLPADSSSSSKSGGHGRTRRSQRAAEEREHTPIGRARERQASTSSSASASTSTSAVQVQTPSRGSGDRVPTPAPRLRDEDATMPLDDQRL